MLRHCQKPVQFLFGAEMGMAKLAQATQRMVGQANPLHFIYYFVQSVCAHPHSHSHPAANQQCGVSGNYQNVTVLQMRSQFHDVGHQQWHCACNGLQSAEQIECEKKIL